MSEATEPSDAAFTARTTTSEFPEERNARPCRTGSSFGSQLGGGGGATGNPNCAVTDGLKAATAASAMTNLTKTALVFLQAVSQQARGRPDRGSGGRQSIGGRVARQDRRKHHTKVPIHVAPLVTFSTSYRMKMSSARVSGSSR